MDRFIVMSKRAEMPNSCMGGCNYYRVAVVEIDPSHGKEPAMISKRAKGVVSILKIWEKTYKGTTSKSSYYKALEEATKIVSMLNE